MQAQVSAFKDMDPLTMENSAVLFLKDRGVITGFADGTFRPNELLTRAQAVKLLMIASRKSPIAIRNAGIYTDLPDTEWYSPYVLTATIKYLVDGYPDGSFRPNDPVNTAEFLKMMTTFFGAKTNTPHTFTDVKSTDWFSQYAGLAASYQLFPDRTLSLLPGVQLTRGDTAVALSQYLSTRPDLFPVITPSSITHSSVSSDSSASSDSSSSKQSTSVTSSSVTSSCYTPSSAPTGCTNVCTQNKSCLKEYDCFVRCASSSGN